MAVSVALPYSAAAEGELLTGEAPAQSTAETAVGTSETALPEQTPPAEEATVETSAAASGTCGDNLRWSYANGQLSITGSGAMYDYLEPCGPWRDLRSQIRSVSFGSGVTSIGIGAFWGCSALESVFTPATLTTINFAAFAECTALKNIHITAGNIGESAFIRCSSLETVTIGPGVKAMGISAFESCASLKGVYINDIAAWCAIDFGSLYANPLQNAWHLYLNGAEVTSVVVPDGVPAVGAFAFINAKMLNNVTIPASVKSIGDYAFYGCTGLAAMNLAPAGLTSIGGNAFDSCTSLKTCNFPGTLSYVGCYAFHWSKIGAVNMQQGEIAKYAFKDTWVDDVTLGSGVTSIGDGAFLNQNIKTVKYGGSPAQWAALPIGQQNESLLAAPSIVCSGAGTPNFPAVGTGVCAGATVQYGKYEQDGNGGNGAEDLLWNVLDVKNGKALVISKYILGFAKITPQANSKSTWADSDMRNIVLRSFTNAAFTGAQQGKIADTVIPASTNPVYGTKDAGGCTDKVFLLSAEEINRYFPTDEDRMAVCTQYAINKFAVDNGGGETALRHGETGTSYWWVRTPGVFDYGSVYVHYTGSLRCDGMMSANALGGYRPAMWVDASAVQVVEDGVSGFVTRLYDVCLGRTPDAAGKANWVNALKAGAQTGATAAQGFIFSNEFKGKNYCNEDYVKHLYSAFLGRDADPAGLKSWVGNLESGMTREEVFNGFSQSDEFKNICAGYGITLGSPIAVPQYGTVPTGPCSVDGKEDGVTSFVKRMYKVCLNREAEAKGLQGWTKQLWEHTASGRKVAQGFIFSNEFKAKNYSNADYVEYLYKAFMGRGSDAAGKADWLGRMQQGWTREQVFDGFVGSDEFTKICNSYGIVRD